MRPEKKEKQNTHCHFKYIVFNKYVQTSFSSKVQIKNKNIFDACCSTGSEKLNSGRRNGLVPNSDISFLGTMLTLIDFSNCGSRPQWVNSCASAESYHLLSDAEITSILFNENVRILDESCSL